MRGVRLLLSESRERARQSPQPRPTLHHSFLSLSLSTGRESLAHPHDLLEIRRPFNSLGQLLMMHIHVAVPTLLHKLAVSHLARPLQSCLHVRVQRCVQLEREPRPARHIVWVRLQLAHQDAHFFESRKVHGKGDAGLLQ